MQHNQQLLGKCIQFLNNIGIPVSFRKIESGCFLPGLLIEQGGIVIDNEALLYPGDILHEAGHIAVVPAGRRSLLNQQAIVESKERETEEMMAIAWSYAACIHLSIDPFFVFHEEGYRGGRDFITDSCRDKNYIGLAMLENIGMTVNEKKAKRSNHLVYPHMIKWLRA